MKAVMVDGKQFQFDFDDLPLKQRLVLLKKGAGEAGHSDALYFYLLLYGDFAGAKEIVADDDNAKEVTNYVIASYFKHALENADEKAIEDLKAKYGTMREFRNALSARNKQNNP